MQIVIEISDSKYQWIKYNPLTYDNEYCEAIRNGTPLPKGHGAIKDVSQIEIPMCEDRAYETWVQVAINAAPTIVEADEAGEEE